MTNKFSLKSMMDPNTVIFVAPILVLVSTLHIFDADDFVHKIGQIEILAAFMICCYYLWTKIADVYEPAIIGKKRIEAVICIVIGVFSAMVLMPPLLTWQFFNLYRASDRVSLKKPVLIAIASMWIGFGILFTSSYIIAKAHVEAMANNAASQESSMPSAIPPE